MAAWAVDSSGYAGGTGDKRVPYFYGPRIGGPLESSTKFEPLNFPGRPRNLNFGAFFQGLAGDALTRWKKYDCYFISAHQVSVVNPAMEKALWMLQKFACDARKGKISENRISLGAPWRHPPRDENPASSYKWAKIQLMDFVQSFVKTEFGVTISSLKVILQFFMNDQ
jgi:hypothetical protein